MALILPAFALVLSLISLSCASSHRLILQKSPHQYVNSAVQHSQLTQLKLQHVANMQSSTEKDVMLLPKKLLEFSSGKKSKKVVKEGAARKGTWREWVEGGPTKSEYFTMDYSCVRRRRPVHNKQIPFLP